MFRRDVGEMDIAHCVTVPENVVAERGFWPVCLDKKDNGENKHFEEEK